MSNSQSFDFSSLKRKPINKLIGKCKQYVGKYLSETAAYRFDAAYKKSKYKDVWHILVRTLERIKRKIRLSEYQKVEKAVLREFPDAKELFEFLVSKEGNEDDINDTSGDIGAVIWIIVAILVIVCIISKNWVNEKCAKIRENGDKSSEIGELTVGDVLSLGNKDSNSINYNDKDKDLMDLLSELSVIYDNTDRYLK